MEVAIVGIGRLGGTVAAELERTGHHVRRVRRGDPIPDARVIWLTVPDSALPAVASECPPAAVVLHASGASDLGVLGDLPHVGSLHPLMTFPSGRVPTPPVPAAVSGTAQAKRSAVRLACALGWTPFEVDGDRRAYHAAAVIAGNFATTLLAEAARLLEVAGVPKTEAPALLAPLALQSVQNAADLGPANALTGPVVRGDLAVIEAHRAALRTHTPDMLSMYEEMLQATRRLAGADPQKIP